MLRDKKWIWFLSLFLSLLVGLLRAYPSLTLAHAEYERSEPAADAVIPEAPAEVHIWFTQELFRREGANILEVFGPDDSQVDKGDARIDDDDRTHMSVSLQEDLPDGQYTVKYTTLSIDDGDDDSGEFSFTVSSDSAGETDQAPASPAEATPLPTPEVGSAASTPAPQPGGSLPCLSGLLFGVLAIGFIIGQKQGWP